ncbi:hypothetical protein UlMin_001073 [Ulmus minor]
MEAITSLILLFLLFSFTTKPVFCLKDAVSSAVLDISGNKLQKGVNYYVLPVFRGMGGGLTLGTARNKSCPLDVVQHKFEVSRGIPVTFSPVNPKEKFVPLSTDLNIKFSASTICIQSTLWKLDRFDDETKQWFLTTGGVEGNPGPATTSNWFKIEKFDRDYKFVFCPGVCSFCKVLCRDVGVFIKNGTRHLALSDQPFRVAFKKA